MTLGCEYKLEITRRYWLWTAAPVPGSCRFSFHSIIIPSKASLTFDNPIKPVFSITSFVVATIVVAGAFVVGGLVVAGSVGASVVVTTIVVVGGSSVVGNTVVAGLTKIIVEK